MMRTDTDKIFCSINLRKGKIKPMKKRVVKVMALFLAVCMVLLSPVSVMAANLENTNAGLSSQQQDGIETYSSQGSNEEVNGQIPAESLEDISETTEQPEEETIPGIEEIPDITGSPETIQEETTTVNQKELSESESGQSSEIQETAEDTKMSQSDVKETRVQEAVDGVMVIDVSQGLVVITDDGFVQGPVGEQHFNPSYADIPSLDSFTPWTGPYRITGSYERTEDQFNTSDPIVEVWGGSPDNPIQIELQDANLNNKKDSNKLSAGSALMIGGNIYFTTTGGFQTIPCAVDLKLTGSNTVIGSKLCSGVEVYDKSWLRIHGEGSLEAIGGEGSAGIGGSKRGSVPTSPTIIIDSGTINATGGEYAAGIGGGMDTAGGTIIINGGNITAQGGLYGAGIGGGLVFYPGDKNLAPLDIHINGGTVQATGGGMGAGIGGGYAERGYTVASEMSIQIGGTADVTAVGGQYGTWNGATGIGAGYTFQSSTEAVNPNVIVKKIEINGGKVSATGAACAAGIGASSGNHVESIVISDGEITALGGKYGAGIGTGYSWKGHPKKSTVGDILISGGTVWSEGGEYAAGVGSGQSGEFNETEQTVGEISITGGNITANGQENGAGIGGSARSTIGNIVISGGEVNSHGGAYAAGVGSGAEAKTGDIMIATGNITSKGGRNGAGIGTGHTGIVDNIQISGGNIIATTDFVVGEDNHVDGCAAGIGGGVDGTAQSITIAGEADVLAIAGEGGAGIGRGEKKNLDGAVIPITITDNPQIEAYAVGTTNEIEESWYQAIDYEGLQSCSTNILLGHFKEMLDEQNDKAFSVVGNTDQAEYQLTMPMHYRSFAATTAGTDIHRVFVDDTLYAGSEEKGKEDVLISKLQVDAQEVNPYWYLQPAEMFTVTFDSQGGTPVEAIQTVGGDTIVKPEDPTREGYLFQGWYKELITENAWDFTADIVNCDLTLYAGWKPIQYDVIFDKNADGAEGTMENQHFKYDEEKKLNENIFKYEGYEFAGWAAKPDSNVTYIDMQSVKNLTTENDGKVYLYAVWNEIGDAEYTIEHYKQSKDGMWPEKASDTEVKSAKPGIEVNATPKVYDGYTFDSTVEGTVSSGAVAKDGSLVLKLYYKVRHNVTFNSDGGSYTPDNQSVIHGEKAVSPENPTKEGYIFEGWYYKIQDESEEKWDFDNAVTGDLRLSAHWIKTEEPETPSHPYTIEHYKQEKDGIWPEKASDMEVKSAKPGTKVSGQAKTFDGYVFDPTVEGTVSSGIVTEDGKLVLKLYYKICHTVTFNSDGGNYTPGNQSVVHGNKADSPESPSKKGHVFEGWYYKNSKGEEEKWNFDNIVTGDLQLTAHWKNSDNSVTPPKPSNPSNGGHINSGSINNSGKGSSVASSVKTGDTSNLVLLFTLFGGSAVVLLTVIIIRKRRDKRQ